MVLADEEGWIIADSEGELVGQRVGEDWGPPAALIAHSGVPVGALYVGVPDWPGLPGGEGLLGSVNRTLLLVAVVAGLGAVLLVLGLSRRILGPVEALTAAARQMEAGDVRQRVEITSHDEIGDLARAFNAMADGLARLEQLRRKSQHGDRRGPRVAHPPYQHPGLPAGTAGRRGGAGEARH